MKNQINKTKKEIYILSIIISLFINIIYTTSAQDNDNIHTLKMSDYTEFVENNKNTKNLEAESIFTLKGEVGPIYISTQKDFKDQDLVSIYEVKQDETIEDIANLYNINKNTIIWANDLQNKKIKQGQILLILPVDGIRHIVKKGDTIKNLSKKYKIDISEIIDYNNIKDDTNLAIGEEIIIPNATTDYISTTQTKTVINKTKNKITSGYFIRPMIGGIKTQGIHGKNAIDIGAPIGTPVRSSAGGTVLVARGDGYNGGYGGLIIIKHNNGTQTLYAHLDSVSVTDGQIVEQGQNIGLSGNTGKSTGPHLHFEIRGAVNPF